MQDMENCLRPAGDRQRGGLNSEEISLLMNPASLLTRFPRNFSEKETPRMSLTLGIYEQVVNELVAAELRGLSEAWQPELRPLDGAESAKVLGAYMGRLLTQVLEYVDGAEGGGSGSGWRFVMK